MRIIGMISGTSFDAVEALLADLELDGDRLVCDLVEVVRDLLQVHCYHVQVPPVPAPYVELTARTSFSFLRGGSTPENLVRRAHDLGHDAVAVTVKGIVPIVLFARAAKAMVWLFGVTVKLCVTGAAGA